MISRRSVIFVSFWVLSLGWQGCSHHALDEAQRVVAEADSLRAAGLAYTDSAALARSCKTLGRYSAFYAFVHRTSLLATYAHACYHYGRLLRKKDDPVAAMQVFISATHTPADDLHILGRVYSNMGDLCHLAGEYPLSYDMYEKSADMYLQNGDTLLYYYGLYSMALESAVQNDEVTAQLLLDSICKYNNRNATLMAYEAQACLYTVLEKYDSVITLVDTLQANHHTEPFVLMLKARAFEHLGLLDSALTYASLVITSTYDDPTYTIDAYYIQSHYNSALTVDSILSITSKRADVQKEWTTRRSHFAQAAQLLEQDLNKKPDRRWLYAVISTLLIIGTGIMIYVRHKQKRQELFSQKYAQMQQSASAIQEKHDELTERYHNRQEHIKKDIDRKCSILKENDKIIKTMAWKNFDKMCTIVDKQFYLLASKLRRKGSLNEVEIRLCVLTLLDCGYEQMADLLFRSPTSIGTLKMRVAKKLGTTSKNLREYLIENECVS